MHAAILSNDGGKNQDTPPLSVNFVDNFSTLKGEKPLCTHPKAFPCVQHGEGGPLAVDEVSL
jgi:hypothetical protein